MKFIRNEKTLFIVWNRIEVLAIHSAKITWHLRQPTTKNNNAAVDYMDDHQILPKLLAVLLQIEYFVAKSFQISFEVRGQASEYFCFSRQFCGKNFVRYIKEHHQFKPSPLRVVPHFLFIINSIELFYNGSVNFMLNNFDIPARILKN